MSEVQTTATRPPPRRREYYRRAGLLLEDAVEQEIKAEAVVVGGVPRRATRIALAYAIVGLLWIWASDLVLVRPVDLEGFWRSGLKGTAFVAVTAAVLLVALRRNEDRLHVHLEELAEAQAAMSALFLRIDMVSDELQRRMAEQIHDGPLQELVAVSMRLELLIRQVNEGKAPRRDDLGDAAAAARSGIASLRGILVGMDPLPVHHAHEMESALRSYVQSVAPGLTLEVTATHCGTVPTGHCQVVFRVLCEAIRNSYRHGGAGTVRVDVEVQNGRRLLFSVTDDGRGFDPEADPGPEHFGLRMMRDRVRLLGGVLVVRSGPAGTRMEARVPV